MLMPESDSGRSGIDPGFRVLALTRRAGDSSQYRVSGTVVIIASKRGQEFEGESVVSLIGYALAAAAP